MHMLKLVISITLILLLLPLIPGCITIESVPQQISPIPSQPGIDEQDPPSKTEPVVEVFMINPALISAGEAATLSWIVFGAESISIFPEIGQVESEGTALVAPDVSTSYTLTASNEAGTVMRTITVKVQSAQPSPQPTHEPFRVVEVIAATEPSPDDCPEILYADITTNGAGTVNYRWESVEGGGYSYTFSVTFASAGTQRVTLIREMRGLPSGKYQIRVMSPNDIISNSIYYTTCGPQ